MTRALLLRLPVCAHAQQVALTFDDLPPGRATRVSVARDLIQALQTA